MPVLAALAGLPLHLELAVLLLLRGQVELDARALPGLLSTPP